ncbi:MAG: tetratricopeptide repeat protein [Cyanobacteria bacterium SZAS LIN-2]|nr:tetratricopeptide repeat protein [Cyanobacteria bacterium SZAS LIN-2]
MKTESIDTLEKHLRLQESLHGPNSVEVARVLCRLANVFLQNSQYGDAEMILRKAAECERKAVMRDSATMEEIKSMLEAVGAKKSELAGSADLESLKVSSDRIPAFTPAFEPLHAPKRNDPLDNAIADAQLQIHRLKQTAGHESLAVADAYTKLADLYCRKEMHDDMEPLLKESLRLRETICGDSHLSVSTDLKNLGRLYFYKRQYELAEPFFKRAMAIREAALGPYHSYVADVAELYAKMLRKTARDSEAQVLEDLVVESRTKYGSDWEKFRLAGVKAMEAGNFLEAQAMWLAALDETADFRFDDPRMVMTLENLAEVYWRRNKFDKAEPLCKQILQISESLLGPEHTDVALAANNLGLLCEKQGKHAEAAILFQQALAIGEKFLGADHPDVVNIRESHAKARYMAQRELEQKLEKGQGRWNRSGWWKVYQKDQH